MPSWATRSTSWAPAWPDIGSGTGCAAWTTWPHSPRWTRRGWVAWATRAAARSRPTSRRSTRALRTAGYAWFDRWLAGRGDSDPAAETAVRPRPDQDLLVCVEGQVNRTFHSRHLLPLAWEEFERQPRPARVPLRDLLHLDPDQADPRVTEITATAKPGQTVVVCINGNEARDWREETEFLRALEGRGHAVLV